MTEFLRDIKRISHLLFSEDIPKTWTKFRLWIAFHILPKDLANFMLMIITKLELEYEKLDSEKRDKISSLSIDFEFRE